MRPSLTTTSANVPSYTVQVVKREVEAQLTFKDASGEGGGFNGIYLR